MTHHSSAATRTSIASFPEAKDPDLPDTAVQIPWLLRKRHIHNHYHDSLYHANHHGSGDNNKNTVNHMMSAVGGSGRSVHSTPSDSAAGARLAAAKAQLAAIEDLSAQSTSPKSLKA